MFNLDEDFAKIDNGATEALSNEIKALLNGKGPAVTGLVLLDLVSLYIAGHVHLGDTDAQTRNLTRTLRDGVLKIFVRSVKKMVPASCEEIGTPY